jgi:hypothetical protein
LTLDIMRQDKGKPFPVRPTRPAAGPLRGEFVNRPDVASQPKNSLREVPPRRQPQPAWNEGLDVIIEARREHWRERKAKTAKAGKRKGPAERKKRAASGSELAERVNHATLLRQPAQQRIDSALGTWNGARELPFFQLFGKRKE